MYATNYERLLEMIRFKTTTGTPSATSLVRRRCVCWYFSVVVFKFSGLADAMFVAKKL